MSSENACEKQAHRKSKVSWGRLIRPGLVGPKLRPYGVSDGYSVNIRIPVEWRFPFTGSRFGGKNFLYARGVMEAAECWTSRPSLE
jgi:hypothetical protein